MLNKNVEKSYFHLKSKYLKNIEKLFIFYHIGLQMKYLSSNY